LKLWSGWQLNHTSISDEEIKVRGEGEARLPQPPRRLWTLHSSVGLKLWSLIVYQFIILYYETAVSNCVTISTVFNHPREFLYTCI